MKTNAGPDEFEESDLSGFPTIDEQIEFLKCRDRVDTMYIMLKNNYWIHWKWSML